MDRVKGPTKSLMKNIANPSTTTQFRRLNIPGSALNRRTICRSKFRDNLQQSLALVRNILTIRIQQGLELRHHKIHPRLKFHVNKNTALSAEFFTFKSGKQSLM